MCVAETYFNGEGERIKAPSRVGRRPLRSFNGSIDAGSGLGRPACVCVRVCGYMALLAAEAEAFSVRMCVSAVL